MPRRWQPSRKSILVLGSLGIRAAPLNRRRPDPPPYDLNRQGDQVDGTSGTGTQPADPTAIQAWEGLSDDDLLGEIVRAHAAPQNVDRAVARHTAALRARRVSWARTGEALGMTRQSARERFSGEE